MMDIVHISMFLLGVVLMVMLCSFSLPHSHSHVHTHTTQHASMNTLCGRLDTVSVHTQYEEMLSTPTEKIQVVAVDNLEQPIPPLRISVKKATDNDASTNQEDGSIESRTSSGISTSDGKMSTCDGDVSTSDSNAGTLENSVSTCANDSGNASYITYGSLNSLLTKHQWEENDSNIST